MAAHKILTMVCFGVMYKIIIAAMKIKILIGLGTLKYQNPIEKQDSIITVNINISIIREVFVLPLPYQHIKAGIGEKIVSPYHIIMYRCGLNPQNIIEYKW